MSSTCVTCRFGCLVSHAGAAFRSDGKRPLGGFTWTINWLWFGVDFAHLSAGFRWKLSPGGGTPFEEKVAPSATHQVAAHFVISSQIKCQPVSTRLNLFLKFFKSLKYKKIAVSWSMNFLVDLNIQNNLISRRKIEKPVVQLADESRTSRSSTKREKIRAISPVERQQVHVQRKNLNFKLIPHLRLLCLGTGGRTVQQSVAFVAFEPATWRPVWKIFKLECKFLSWCRLI